MLSKQEYLNRAKELKWNEKIPVLGDGTYDCDVFCNDNAVLPAFAISGNFYAGDGCTFDTIYCGKNIFLGDATKCEDIEAGENIYAGDFIKAGSIKAKNVTLGDTIICEDITATEDISTGDFVETDRVFSAQGNISLGEYISIESIISFLGSIVTKSHLTTCFILCGKSLTLGDNITTMAEGKIECLGDVQIGSNSNILSINGKNVTLKDNVIVSSLVATGLVTIGNDSKVDSIISLNGDIAIGSYMLSEKVIAFVGDITALDAFASCVVFAKGNVTLGSHAYIKEDGILSACKKVTIGSNSLLPCVCFGTELTIGAHSKLTKAEYVPSRLNS